MRKKNGNSPLNIKKNTRMPAISAGSDAKKNLPAVQETQV